MASVVFPSHSSRSAAHDQHGHEVPFIRAIAPLVASAAVSRMA